MSFAAADEMRRWYGRALDLWLARTETPSRLVLERSRVKLRDYGDEGNRPSLLIIPAPIKKPYIWDLTPSVSVVLACLQARFRVYVLEWTETPPDGSDNGLAVYVDELILECAKAIGEPAVLAGHSLGGTFATIFASRHPKHVRALIGLKRRSVFQERPELLPISFVWSRPQTPFATSQPIPAPCSTR